MNIFIIGNGFDLHCGLHTHYSDFYNEYLIKIDPEFAKSFSFLFDGDPEWGTFETVFSHVSGDNLCRIFHKNKLTDISHIMEEKFYFKLHDYFDGWAIQISSQKCVIPEDMIDLFSQEYDHNVDKVFSMNYTTFADRLCRSPVIHLHGYKDLLNHDVVPADFGDAFPERDSLKTKVIMPPLETEPKIAYFHHWFRKDTPHALQQIRDSLSPRWVVGNKRIYVIGESMSDVDMPYFREIFKLTKEYVPEWIAYCHNENDRDKYEKTFTKMGVHHFSFAFYKPVDKFDFSF